MRLRASGCRDCDQRSRGLGGKVSVRERPVRVGCRAPLTACQNLKLRQCHSVQDEGGTDDKAHRPAKY